MDSLLEKLLKLLGTCMSKNIWNAGLTIDKNIIEIKVLRKYYEDVNFIRIFLLIRTDGSRIFFGKELTYSKILMEWKFRESYLEKYLDDCSEHYIEKIIKL